MIRYAHKSVVPSLRSSRYKLVEYVPDSVSQFIVGTRAAEVSLERVYEDLINELSMKFPFM